MKLHLHLRISFILFIIGVLLGIYFAIQTKALPVRVTNPILPYSSLKNASQTLTTETENLKKQIESLRTQINEAEKTIKSSKAVSKDLLEELEKLKEAVGLKSVEGPGVIITLDDAPLANTPEKVITAADLRDIVNLLWRAEAEAIAISKERLVATSSIDAIGDDIFINNNRYNPPFTITAIGDPVKLHGYLVNPDYLKDFHRRVESYHLVFKITEKAKVSVPAYSGAFKAQFAKVEK